MLTTLLAISLLAARQTPAVQFEPYTLQGPENQRVAAELGRLRVPERRARPDRRIDVAFVRLKSLTPSSRPPIVYLDGGPGGGGFSAARVPHMFDLFQALRQHSDVILLSQRGTGLSTPRLACPAAGPLPAGFYASRAAMTEAMLPRGQACVQHWRAKGVDVAAYNTEESADDIDDLRKALGADRISLLGFSYGTHLALSAIRRHEASIDRAVLLGTEGPDDTWKLPLAYDLQVKRIAALVAADSSVGNAIPDFHGLLGALLLRLEQSPQSVPIQFAGQSLALTLGADGLRALLAQDIGDTNDIPAIVRGVYEASRGDFTLIGRLMQRRYSNMSAGGGNLMGMAMDCASGASPGRLAEIRDQQPHSLWKGMVDFPYPDACTALELPMLTDAFRFPVAARTPVLFISGSLDANTPPYQADRVRWGFPASSHIVVQNAGHESTLEPLVVRDAIVRFLSGEPIADAVVAAQALRFTISR